MTNMDGSILICKVVLNLHRATFHYYCSVSSTVLISVVSILLLFDEQVLVRALGTSHSSSRSSNEDLSDTGSSSSSVKTPFTIISDSSSSSSESKSSDSPISPAAAYLQSGFYFAGGFNELEQKRHLSSNQSWWKPAPIDRPLEGDFVELVSNVDGPGSDTTTYWHEFAYSGGWLSRSRRSSPPPPVPTTSSAESSSLSSSVLMQKEKAPAEVEYRIMLATGNTGSIAPTFQGLSLTSAESSSAQRSSGSGYSWPDGSDSTQRTFAGFVLHHPTATLWLVPFPGKDIFAVALTKTGKGSITQYKLPTPPGQGSFPGWFSGGCVHNDDVWIAGESMLRIQTSAPPLPPVLSYPDTITGIEINENEGPFNGAVYDGQSLWMVPYRYDEKLVQFNLTEMKFVKHSFGSSSSYSGQSGGGTYDGTKYVWMGPRTSSVVLKVNVEAKSSTTLSNWPSNVVGEDQNGFNGALFDTKYVWLIPLFGSAIVRIDVATEAMMGFLIESRIRGGTNSLFCQSPILDSQNQMLHLGLADGRIVSFRFSSERRSTDHPPPTGGGESESSAAFSFAPVSSDTRRRSAKGVTTGAIVGICVGVGCVALFSGCILFVAFRRDRRRRDQPHLQQSSSSSAPVVGVPVETPSSPQQQPSLSPPPPFAAAVQARSNEDEDLGYVRGRQRQQHYPPPPKYFSSADHVSPHANVEMVERGGVASGGFEAFSHNCEKSFALVPCGHPGACRRCAGSVVDKFCPICGTRIEGVVKRDRGT